jgi:hypothetical protein
VLTLLFQEKNPMKSERLKKLEAELQDLEQCLKLGLVPKRDMQKYQEEREDLKEKIIEEQNRLKTLKESGDVDEFVPPKRGGSRSGFQSDMPTIPDMDYGDNALTDYDDSHEPDASGELDTSSLIEEADGEDSESSETEDEEDSYFSDKARWKRGGIIDPEEDEW